MELARSQGRVALDVIILRDRGGRVWHIRIRAIGDQLYFEGGWKRFREDNCLEAADFIVFSHVENNLFKFKIFEGSSRCEKIIKERGDDIMEEEEEEEEQEQDYCRACKASKFKLTSY